MIKIFDYKGKTHYLAPGAIASLTEASTSSQWHGIRCIVKCFDGSVIEANQSADIIAAEISKLKGGAAVKGSAA